MYSIERSRALERNRLGLASTAVRRLNMRKMAIRPRKLRCHSRSRRTPPFVTLLEGGECAKTHGGVLAKTHSNRINECKNDRTLKIHSISYFFSLPRIHKEERSENFASESKPSPGFWGLNSLNALTKWYGLDMGCAEITPRRNRLQ